MRKTAPLLVELAGFGDAMIARQQIGIKPHVGRAARVGVIAQANELCAGQSRAKLHQRGDVRAANLRTKNDDQVLLAAKLVAKIMWRLAPVRCRQAAAIFTNLKRARNRSSRARNAANLPSAPCRNLREPSGLALQLDGLRIHHVQLRRHAGERCCESAKPAADAAPWDRCRSAESPARCTHRAWWR